MSQWNESSAPDQIVPASSGLRCALGEPDQSMSHKVPEGCSPKGCHEGCGASPEKGSCVQVCPESARGDQDILCLSSHVRLGSLSRGSQPLWPSVRNTYLSRFANQRMATLGLQEA